MTLHLYFARRFLGVFLALLGLFGVMLALIDMVEQIRTLDRTNAGIAQAVRLTLLNLPAGLYRILPLITILASVVLFVNLSRSSELVIARAAGRSALGTLVAPAVVAGLLGVLAVTAFNPIVAATEKQYDAISARYRNGDVSVLSIGPDGLWLRQGGEEGQMVIRAAGANLDGTELDRVSFLSFDAGGTPQQRIEARRARLLPGHWRAENAKVWNLTDDNPEVDAVQRAELDVGSDLTLDRIRDSFGAPSTIAIWQLPAFIRQLEAAGFSARSHRTWLQMELALPLLLVAMVLAGAGFTMRPSRFGKTGVMVLLALAMGFAVFFLRNFAQILGDRGQIPVALAAWSPPLIALLLALGLLLHLEDG